MAKVKRETPAELDHARLRVAEMYLKGCPQAAIAAELGVSQQTISNDLAAIRKRWREETITNIDEAICEHLARIDRLELANNEGYVRSLHAKTTVRNVRRGAIVVESTETTEPNPEGNPAYLQGIAWCIAERAKTLGLHANPKLTIAAHAAEPYDAGRNAERVLASLQAFLLLEHGEQREDDPPPDEG